MDYVEIPTTPDRIPEEGTFALFNYSVPAASTEIYTINLSRSDYEMGKMLLYVPITGLYKRAFSTIMFTTVLNDAKAASSIKNDIVVSLCVFTNWWTRGYGYDSDGRLSDNYFRKSGGNVRIASCQIVGDTIELGFRNGHATSDATIDIDGNWQVY